MITGAERGRLLARMGVTVYVPRGAPDAPHPESVPAPGPVSSPTACAPAGGETPVAGSGGPMTAPAAGNAVPVSALQWPELERAVASCVGCALHRSRRSTVFGAGARDADWMVIGLSLIHI